MKRILYALIVNAVILGAIFIVLIEKWPTEFHISHWVWFTVILGYLTYKSFKKTGNESD